MQKPASPPLLTALLFLNVLLTGALVSVALLWPLGGDDGATQAAFAVESASQTWEYTCVETDREPGQLHQGGFAGYLEERFAGLGEEGWEMVGYAMNNGANVRYVCFKRPRKTN